MKKEQNEKLLENTADIPQKKKIETKPLSRCYRFFLYIIILSIEGVMNVSSGLLSSASKNIKATLHMNDKAFGMFGTSNAFGRLIGSSLYVALNQKMSRKWLMVLFVGFKSLFIIGFKLSNNGLVLITLRGFVGLTHMPPTIYVACWIDQYGIQAFKNAQMASVQLIQPAGKLLGYLIHILVGEKNWQNGFVCEGIYLIFTVICMAISSEDYFSRVLYSKKEIDPETKISLFGEEEKKKEEKKEEVSLIGDLKLLVKNKIFMLGIVSRCVLFGLNTGLHFWISDYMRNVVHVEGYYVFFAYSIICIVGPFGGVITNSVFKPCIGGYDSKSASWPLVFLHLGSCIFGIGISFMRTFIPFVISTVGYFVFNSSALPILQGILITSTEKRLSNSGFAIANLLTQVLTSGPAPVMYGAINDKFKTVYPGLAMFCLMFITVLALPFLVIMAILRNKEFDRLEKEKKKGKELEDQ